MQIGRGVCFSNHLLCCRSILLGGVILPDPPFEGGALFAWEGGNVPLQSYKQTQREAPTVGERYFTPEGEEAVTNPDDRWTRLYESRLLLDSINEEIWLLYALEAFHRSPTSEGAFLVISALPSFSSYSTAKNCMQCKAL